MVKQRILAKADFTVGAAFTRKLKTGVVPYLGFRGEVQHL
jgi:hypothetical protein